ncbi:MAG: hypothetical protein ACREGA_05215 [Candidatus Saccharimonadales bacterium]
MDEDFWDELQFTWRQTAYGLVVAGAVLFIVFGLVWWFTVYHNPQRTFWGMISSSLATSGVTRHIMESQKGQKLDEYIQLELGANNLARSYTTLTQNNNVVKTESIGATKTDYTRYLAFQSSAKNSQGQPLNFSSVIGVWSQSPAKVSGQTSDALQHLFGQTLLGVVPIANLTSAERGVLITKIRRNNVYVPDFSNVKTKTVASQRAYIYNVAVEPVAYAAISQQFARYEGFGKLSELEPSQYQGAAPEQVKFAVGINSHQLLQISYGQNHSESYSGYGQQPKIAIPTKTISSNALKQRLAKLNK